jgi:OOP family OmpA-OmpF porin
MRKSLFGVVLAGALGVSTTAWAQETRETWLLAGAASGAVGLDSNTRDGSEGGLAGGLGLYRSLAPAVALGARIDGGTLGLAAESDTDLVDNSNQDRTGFGSAAAALRLRPLGTSSDVERGTGLYLEAAGGPGLFDDDVRGVVNPGAGYIIRAGDVGLGPTARYNHIITPDAEDIQIGTIGLELVLLDRRRAREEPPKMERPVPMPEPRLEPAARVEKDSDQDGIFNGRDQCPSQPETKNGIDDTDGCPDNGDVEMKKKDQVVIDEVMFFPYDSAQLQTEGMEKLDAIAAIYADVGEGWAMLRVQGHADRRGPESYNEELSRRRAAAVKDYLVAKGIPSHLVDVEAYGEQQPAVPDATTEPEYAQNRRVEFRIIRK